MEDPADQVGIDWLPQELLDEILGHLPRQEVSRLGRCNQRLRARSEHALYGTPEARDQAVKWACENGVIGTVATALVHGASSSTVSVATREGPFKTFTLHLAAKHHQVDMFAYLIREGARVGSAAVKNVQVEAFVRCLCRPGNARMTRVFLEAGLADDLYTDLKNRLLMAVLESSSRESMREAGMFYPDTEGLFDSVRILLDAGADPNHVQSTRHSQVSKSPLSAALLAHRRDLFWLLTQEGADINGVQGPADGKNYHRLPLHVPVCAAAFLMATAGEDASMMKMCLDHGADINVHVPFAQGRDPYLGDEYEQLVGPEDPADEIRYRNGAPLAPEQKEHPNIIGKLQFLLNNGATTPTTLKHGEEYSYPSFGLHSRWEYRHISPWSPFSVLLDKWVGGSYSNAHPNLLLALKVLIRHGSLKENTGSLIAYHDHLKPSYELYPTRKWRECYHPAQIQQLDPGRFRPVDKAHFLFFWREIVATILESPDHHEDVNQMLFQYIASKRKQEFEPKLAVDTYGLDPEYDSPNDRIFGETVRQLVYAGANVNFVSSAGSPHLSGSILHVACQFPGCRSIRMPEVLVRMFGAHTNIVCHYRGWTPGEMLMWLLGRNITFNATSFNGGAGPLPWENAADFEGTRIIFRCLEVLGYTLPVV